MYYKARTHTYWKKIRFTLCAEWMHDFEFFYEQMGDKKHPTWFLDRHEVIRGFNIKNSFWNTTKEPITVNQQGNAWCAFIHLFREGPAQVVYLGSYPSYDQAYIIYVQARELRDAYEYDETWNRASWLKAIARPRPSTAPIIDQNPDQTNKFYQRTYNFWRTLTAFKSRQLIGSPFRYDFYLFLDVLGYKRHKMWFLARHDHDKPHNTHNSYYDKRLEARTVYPKPKTDKYFATLRLETHPTDRIFYLGSGTKDHCNDLYRRAKVLKDANEISPEWTNQDLKKAITHHSLDKSFPIRKQETQS